ncbi:hypothetical protein PCL_04881 [Purpureocillium lilacinum]|uniref:Uncharacterized protein n=1 Tax=Purpureocillium lilacinum TaxID=33203 RepID=A0A2U3DWW5_PURLI|nr:hypothetical protein Purlil1_11759 [Purpureocillium lilacinum]PWI66743.1 hypothetical protein PCL_04881 [Purpureocillium lilacinum]
MRAPGASATHNRQRNTSARRSEPIDLADGYLHWDISDTPAREYTSPRRHAHRGLWGLAYQRGLVTAKKGFGYLYGFASAPSVSSGSRRQVVTHPARENPGRVTRGRSRGQRAGSWSMLLSSV